MHYAVFHDTGHAAWIDQVRLYSKLIQSYSSQHGLTMCINYVL